MILQDYLIYAVYITSVLPLLLLYLREVKRIHADAVLAIKPYLWLMLIGAFYELIFTGLLKIPSAYWFTAYTFLEFLVLWYFFRKLFLNKHKYFFFLSLVIVSLGFILVLFYWSLAVHRKLEGYLSVPISLFIFISVFRYYKKLFFKAELVSLWITPVFYFISGLMIYFSVGVFVSLLIYDLKVITGLSEKYWIIFIIVALIMRLMITIGIWIGTEKKP